MTRPLLLLEINEVPWRLIDRFKDDSRYVSIARFFNHSRNLTNVAVDAGELSPWITWPTFHRGMTGEEHGVKNLGQDPGTFRGTPIWQEFRNRGYSIGVLGSLQSWPPIAPGAGGFYIPDTFAHDSSCIPESLEPLQRFNLQQTASNGRVISRGSPFSTKSISVIKRLPMLGIRPSTLISGAVQIIAERFDETRVSRRPIFQAILFWDVFRKLFNYAHPPAFATFFTNHVASVMHRYWRDVFPEDFGEQPALRARRHLGTMEFAIRVVDRMLSDAMAYCERNPDLIVVFASSMGQTAIHRKAHEGIETVMADVPMLIERLGFDRKECQQLLAMMPQVAVEIKDGEIRKEFVRALMSCKTSSGAQLFGTEEIGNSLSITVSIPRRRDIEAGFITIGKERALWQEVGIRAYHIDAGTGYHVPEGAMAVYGSGIQADHSRRALPADRAKEFLMELTGLR